VPASIYSRTLQRAAELVGGRAALCRLLQVPAADLQKWIEDKAATPRSVFLRAVDVILTESAPSSDPGPGDPPPSRDCSSSGEAPMRFD